MGIGHGAWGMGQGRQGGQGSNLSPLSPPLPCLRSSPISLHPPHLLSHPTHEQRLSLVWNHSVIHLPIG
jgi:hypothetical protein